MADTGRRLIGLLPAVATAAAEGAWVSVVYAAVQIGIRGRPAEPSTWAFVAAAAAGIGLARLARPRANAILTAVLVILAAVVGIGAAAGAWGPARAGAVDGALAAHGAGLLLGLAAWRGTRHVDPATDDLAVGSLLRWGIPALAIPWAVGSIGATRQAFASEALPATLLFVGAALVAVGLTRLDALDRASGVDWRSNRTWVALLVGVVAGVIVIGTPVALVLGISLDAAVRTIVSPVGGLADHLGSLFGRFAETLDRGGAPAASMRPTAPGSAPSIGGIPEWLVDVAAVLVAVAMVAGLVALARLAHCGRRAPASPRATVEERRISLRPVAPRVPTLRFPRFARVHRPRPRTASQAYLALIRDLADDDRVARPAAESPARHAQRLRATGGGSLALDLLAADYELERYAGITLTPTEVRRAIRRWRAARRVGRVGRGVMKGGDG